LHDAKNEFSKRQITLKEIMKLYPNITREEATKIRDAMSRYPPKGKMIGVPQKPNLKKQIEELYG